MGIKSTYRRLGQRDLNVNGDDMMFVGLEIGTGAGVLEKYL